MMTAIVIMSNRCHLCMNSGKDTWDVFRQALLQLVIDHLTEAREPGTHVLSACIAHDDHFHPIDSQADLFAVLSNVEAHGREFNGTTGSTCH